MKLLLPITAILAAASAGHIYSSQSPAENYANSAEDYQSQLEYQQQGLYSDQQHYAGHEGEHQQSGREKSAKVLSFMSERDDHGYQYGFETDNGIKAQEHGQTTHDKGTEAHGAYSYTGDDGHVYTVTYTADEHGFRAEGHHLPTPPPMPEAIAKALEQNAKDEAAGIYDDGKYTQENHQESNQYQHPSHGYSSDAQDNQVYQHQGVQSQGYQQTQYQTFQHGGNSFQHGSQNFPHDGFQPSTHMQAPEGYYHKKH